MKSLFEQFKNQINAVDLGQCASDGIDAYKEEMKDKVPRGVSPVKGGTWVQALNRNYETAKSLEGFEGLADLDYGKKRYERAFNRVNKSANSAEFQYDSTYRSIAEKHQTGRYDYGDIKPRELIPQSKEELPDMVLEAIKDSFIRQLQ